MKIANKRKAGEILGRGGISQRIVTLADEISQGTYKEAIEKAGQIAVLVQAASFDDYWDEKANIGIHREQDVLQGLIEGDIQRDRVICFSNPYSPKVMNTQEMIAEISKGKTPSAAISWCIGYIQALELSLNIARKELGLKPEKTLEERLKEQQEV